MLGDVERLDLEGGYDPGGHDDLTARVERIGDGVVWFDADGDRFGYDLHDGTDVLR